MRKSFCSLLISAAIFSAFALSKNEAELHKAAAEGDVKKVQATLKKLNKKKEHIDAAGSERDKYTERGGWTALYLAAVNDKIEVVKVLLAAGASASGSIHEGFGDEHCFIADLRNKPEILELFLSAKGASSCAPIFFGDDAAFSRKLLGGGLEANAEILGTPLILKAVTDDRVDLVEMLIAFKANVNYKVPADHYDEDNKGKSVLDIAKRGNNARIIQLLKAAGAK